MTIGNTIPKLTLTAYHRGEEVKVKLDGYKNTWFVLVFYPGDFTFVCPTELEEAAALYPQFKKLGAELMSVSTDSVHVHKAWHDTSLAIKKVKFPMLADPTGRLCREFGTYIEDEGVSLRGTFIIDPDGVVKTMEIHDNAIGRSMAETVRKLQAAKFVREHKGLGGPASGEPGKKNLKPGMDLVGKI